MDAEPGSTVLLGFFLQLVITSNVQIANESETIFFILLNYNFSYNQAVEKEIKKS